MAAPVWLTTSQQATQYKVCKEVGPIKHQLGWQGQSEAAVI